MKVKHEATISKQHYENLQQVFKPYKTAVVPLPGGTLEKYENTPSGNIYRLIEQNDTYKVIIT